MTRPLSVAHLTAINLDPPTLINAAAETGFDTVGLRLQRVTDDTPGYPIMHDPVAMRATKATIATTGVTVADIEFVRITPETNITELRPLLDAGAELGAKHVITAPYDPDHDRLADTLGQLAVDCTGFGLMPVLEFFPWTSVPDLNTCWDVVQAAGDNVGILVDSLHFDRSNSCMADLAKIPADRLPFAHLCDAPINPPYTTEALLRTARAARLSPGAGDIDLKEFLRGFSSCTPLSIEVPSQDMPANPVVHLKALHDATQRLLNSLDVS